MRVLVSTASAVALLAALTAAPLSAEVVRIEVQSRADVAGGQTFGTAGAYEKIAGRIFFAVDPSLPANRIVADLDKAFGALDAKAAEREERFRQARAAEADKGKVLDRKFQEGLKKAKDSPDPPRRPFDYE